MTHPPLLLFRQLRQRLPHSRQKKHRIIPKPIRPSGFLQHDPRNLTPRPQHHLAILRQHQRTHKPRSAVIQRQSAVGIERLRQIPQQRHHRAIIPLVFAAGPNLKPQIIRNPRRPHPRLPPQRIHLQPRVIRKHEQSRGQLRIFDGLFLRIALKRRRILRRLRHRLDPRQRQHLHTLLARTLAEFPQLSFVRRGRIDPHHPSTLNPREPQTRVPHPRPAKPGRVVVSRVAAREAFVFLSVIRDENLLFRSYITHIGSSRPEPRSRGGVGRFLHFASRYPEPSASGLLAQRGKGAFGPWGMPFCIELVWHERPHDASHPHNRSPRSHRLLTFLASASINTCATTTPDQTRAPDPHRRKESRTWQPARQLQHLEPILGRTHRTVPPTRASLRAGRPRRPPLVPALRRAF